MIRFVTKDGLKKLQTELEERKTTLRQKIAKEIKEAKEQGDLSENAEYAEAKTQQNENEARIAELETIIKNSQVVEKNDGAKGIQIGSSFKVKWNGSEAQFKIVGSNEADPLVFQISNESPMGRAFLGRKKGDEVAVETPAGKVKYKVLAVE